MIINQNDNYPCPAVSPAIALWLQSTPPPRRVAGIGSFGLTISPWLETSEHVQDVGAERFNPPGSSGVT